MARDYKNRTSKNRARKQAQKVAWWKWLLIVFLIALFVMFLVFLRNSAPEPQKTQVQVIKKIIAFASMELQAMQSALPSRPLRRGTVPMTA